MAKQRVMTIEKNEKELLEIADQVSSDLREFHKITITDIQGIPTIVGVFFQELFKYIGKHPDEDINFAELFSAQLEEGKLTMGPGPYMKQTIKSDNDTEE